MNQKQCSILPDWRFSLAVVLGFMLFSPSFCQDPARFQGEIDRFKSDTADYSRTGNLVLFTGSSTIRMWTTLTEDFPDLTVRNRGFGGSHMSDLLYYADTVILQCRPARIFIYEGDNDLAAGERPEEILEAAGRLVKRIRQHLPRTPICFISAKPSIARWEMKDSYLEYNRQLKIFTEHQSNVSYLNAWDIMIGKGGRPDSGLFLADSLHMNARGYALWKQIADEFLRTRIPAPEVMFGVCAAMDISGRLKDEGFDFIEGSVGRDLIPPKSDADFARKLVEFDTSRLQVISCNGFLPGTLKVTGQDARQDTVLRYAAVAFRRAAAAGIKFIVFGSGGARSVPEGFDPAQARRQFTGLLRKMGPVARKYGITVAIEPLQKSECNFINTVGEAVDIAREVNDPNIRVLADIFHMMREKEGPDALIRAGKYLVHCHIAELKDRTAPGMAGDDFRPYFAALKKAGYRGGISIEGSWKADNLEKALQVLKEQWESNQ
jgi:sugar phosphate isomerase/epimerase/lysophospholipase L1-like esterase